jgi:hypothetical protein
MMESVLEVTAECLRRMQWGMVSQLNVATCIHAGPRAPPKLNAANSVDVA